jgi:hypothetical protein
MKKCRHIWAHEHWAIGIKDDDPRRYPPSLYHKGKSTTSCCGEEVTKDQWLTINANAETVWVDAPPLYDKKKKLPINPFTGNP